jgi:hypothetical protein
LHPSKTNLQEHLPTGYGGIDISIWYSGEQVLDKYQVINIIYTQGGFISPSKYTKKAVLFTLTIRALPETCLKPATPPVVPIPPVPIHAFIENSKVVTHFLNTLPELRNKRSLYRIFCQDKI